MSYTVIIAYFLSLDNEKSLESRSSRHILHM